MAGKTFRTVIGMDANCQLNWAPGEVAGSSQPTLRVPWDQEKSMLVARWLQSHGLVAANTFSAVDASGSCCTWGRLRKTAECQTQTRQIDFLCASPVGIDDCFVDRVMGSDVRTDHRPVVLRTTGLSKADRRRKQAACIMAWTPDEAWGE